MIEGGRLTKLQIVAAAPRNRGCCRRRWRKGTAVPLEALYAQANRAGRRRLSVLRRERWMDRPPGSGRSCPCIVSTGILRCAGRMMRSSSAPPSWARSSAISWRTRVGEVPAEAPAPLPNGLVADLDAARLQDQLDLPEVQAEAVVQPHGLADDRGREAEAAVKGACLCPRTCHESPASANLTAPAAAVRRLLVRKLPTRLTRTAPAGLFAPTSD